MTSNNEREDPNMDTVEQQSTERHPLPASGVRFHRFPATVTRLVHYVSYETEHEQKACRAALVTVAEDADGRVGLRVFHPTGDEVVLDVKAHHIDENDPEWPRLSEGVQGHQQGTWHWPERA